MSEGGAWFPGCGVTRRDCNLAREAFPGGQCGGASEPLREKSYAALFQAVKAGDTSYVSTLLQQGYFVDCTDQRGWTALHYASQAGYVPIARLLLKNNATAGLLAKVRPHFPVPRGGWPPSAPHSSRASRAALSRGAGREDEPAGAGAERGDEGHAKERGSPCGLGVPGRRGCLYGLSAQRSSRYAGGGAGRPCGARREH
jgi:ankyrin repeat protein